MVPNSPDSAFLEWKDLRHVAFPCMSLWKRSRAGQINEPDWWLLHGSEVLCAKRSPAGQLVTIKGSSEVAARQNVHDRHYLNILSFAISNA
jgi:hypothetical protein